MHLTTANDHVRPPIHDKILNIGLVRRQRSARFRGPSFKLQVRASLDGSQAQQRVRSVRRLAICTL
jgi:hypothetical protein